MLADNRRSTNVTGGLGWRSAVTEGWGDLIGGLRSWRICHVLGLGPLRQRYARSLLGQFWIVVSTAITVTAFGLVWALLWNVPVQQYLPYIAASHIVWMFINSTILEAVGAFPAHGRYFLTHEAPLSTVVYGAVYRNFVLLLHNLPIALATLVIFRVRVGWDLFLVLPALALAVIFLVMSAYAVALICTRFRDVAQIVGNAMQILFFVTPVMWQPELLPAKHHWLVDFNPFAGMLSLVRDPLLGRAVRAESWVSVGVSACVLLLVVPVFVGLWRRRIVFWV